MDLKKKIACFAADALIRDGMKLGLGTGSTAGWLVDRLKDLLESGKIRTVIAVPTSLDTRFKCEAAGIPVTSLSDPRLCGSLDLTIDGADEIDPEGNLIKGGGGAHLSEKIVASASRVYAIIAESRKLVKKLGGNFPVPVEIIQAAAAPVTQALTALGAQDVTLRVSDRFCGPVFTEHGNIILDVCFPPIENPRLLEQQIKIIPGVVESGIFTRPVNHVIIGYPDGRITQKDF